MKNASALAEVFFVVFRDEFGSATRILPCKIRKSGVRASRQSAGIYSSALSVRLFRADYFNFIIDNLIILC
jgi:hypothetical protein